VQREPGCQNNKGTLVLDEYPEGVLAPVKNVRGERTERKDSRSKRGRVIIKHVQLGGGEKKRRLRPRGGGRHRTILVLGKEGRRDDGVKTAASQRRGAACLEGYQKLSEDC